ncbi:MAG: hypothetical protein IPG18_18385 [Saprospiraceae bacterium]|nr:hypothetical protein [Saprospiraceae bacterium]
MADYDNTIIFTEKRGKDQADYGINLARYLKRAKRFIYENRNGNSDAKAFQLDTLERMFQHLKDNNISRIDKFRADATS